MNVMLTNENATEKRWHLFDMNKYGEYYNPAQVAAQDGVLVPLPAPVAVAFTE